jgi:general secretion pathway protein G
MKTIDSAHGFTLTELLIVLTISAALAALAIPRFIEYKTDAEIAKAVADMRTLDTSIKVYQLDTGNLPTSLSSVPSGNISDPWGRPYEYLKIEGDTKATGKSRKDQFLVPINSDFDLYSMGRDGESSPPLTAKNSQDDVVRANDGGYFGLASQF